MPAVLHTPFLQALGYAIINSLWQFALLWLLYFAINSLFKLSSHQKYTAGLVLQFAGFIWFTETIHYYYTQSLLAAQQPAVQPNLFFYDVAGSAAGAKQQFFLLLLRFEQIFPYLSIAYLALLFILAFRWLYAYAYAQQVRSKEIGGIDPPWTLFVEKVCVELGIARKVDIFLSKLIHSPLTVGLVKPVILIPVAAVSYLTPQQLEAVILHELAHVKRFDYLFNLLLALIEASLFFNPFMQLINQQIKKERENCCDDWVLKYEYSAASYARALLEIASRQTDSLLLGLKAVENSQLLINRIKRIIEKKERTFFNYKHQLLALLVMTTVLSSLSLVSRSKKAGAMSSPPVSKKFVFEPIAAKVSNPLFNPVFFLTNSSNSSKPVSANKKKDERVMSKTVTGSNRVITSITDARVAIEPTLIFSNSDGFTGENSAENVSATPYPTSANDLRSERKAASRNVPTPPEPEALTVDLPVDDAVLSEQFRMPWPPFVKEKSVALENASQTLRDALKQVRLVKKQGELIKLNRVRKSAARKVEKQKFEQPDEVISLNELRLLQHQLQYLVDSIYASNIFTTAVNRNLTLNFHLPGGVYKQPEQPELHRFSYDFSTTPKIRIVDLPALKGKQKAIDGKKVVVQNDDEQIDQEKYNAAPARLKTRILRVLRI